MTEPAANYTPIDLQKISRTQAIRVWILTTVIILIWVGSVVAAPLLEAQSIYTFFSYVCHQIPERSFHIAERQMAVCSRCSGVYFGLLAGILIYPLWRNIDETEPIPRVWLFLSLIPIAIDWSLGMFGIWENTHLSRFITGLILGIACATYIVPAVVEVVRNLSRNRPRHQ